MAGKPKGRPRIITEEEVARANFLFHVSNLSISRIDRNMGRSMGRYLMVDRDEWERWEERRLYPVRVKQIDYVVGDLFESIVNGKDGCVMIAHVCNDLGAWGAGFVVPLGRQFPVAEQRYRAWSKNRDPFTKVPFALGQSQVIEVAPYMFVANMVAQKGLIAPDNPHPLDYAALDSCMKKVADSAKMICSHLHCPKFGAGLAGGDWSKIEPLICKNWIGNGLRVTIYSLE